MKRGRGFIHLSSKPLSVMLWRGPAYTLLQTGSACRLSKASAAVSKRRYVSEVT